MQDNRRLTIIAETCNKKKAGDQGRSVLCSKGARVRAYTFGSCLLPENEMF